MIDIQIDDRELQAALQRLSRKLGDLTPVMRDIGELIIERTKDRFETETGPDGQRWKPLADSTLLGLMKRAAGGRIAKKGGGTKVSAIKALARKRILFQDGDLSRQFHYQAGRDAVTVSNAMKYAAIHQFGGQAGRGKKVTIPARPFLPITSSGQWLGTDDREAVMEILADWLARP